MLPIIVCSIIAFAIIAERLWTLRIKRVIPRTLVAQVWEWANERKLDVERMQKLRSGSPLGRVLAAGLMNRNASREIMKEAIFAARWRCWSSAWNSRRCAWSRCCTVIAPERVA